jgi:hypothetical protein
MGGDVRLAFFCACIGDQNRVGFVVGRYWGVGGEAIQRRITRTCRASQTAKEVDAGVDTRCPSATW